LKVILLDRLGRCMGYYMSQ